MPCVSNAGWLGARGPRWAHPRVGEQGPPAAPADVALEALERPVVAGGARESPLPIDGSSLLPSGLATSGNPIKPQLLPLGGGGSYSPCQGIRRNN